MVLINDEAFSPHPFLAPSGIPLSLRKPLYKDAFSHSISFEYSFRLISRIYLFESLHLGPCWITLHFRFSQDWFLQQKKRHGHHLSIQSLHCTGKPIYLVVAKEEKRFELWLTARMTAQCPGMPALPYRPEERHWYADLAALADEENTAWSFCPNLGAAIFFSAIFGLTTIIHVAQAISYRKGYSWVIIASALLQTAAYAIRAASIQKPTQDGLYTTWFILILVWPPFPRTYMDLKYRTNQVSPLLTNAYVYMVMGRLVYNFTTNSKLAGIKAWRFTLYFVLLDILWVMLSRLNSETTHRFWS